MLKSLPGHSAIIRLRKIIPEAFETITLDMIARFFIKSNDYETAYRAGHSCDTVDKIVKTYKSHRIVTE